MNWTREEVILIINDYFDMFRMELNSMHYNKAAHRRKLAPLLHDRDNSIEFKHQNISGVLANLGLPYIKGYKPLFQYQQLLEDEVLIFLENNKSFFEKEFKRFADEMVKSTKKINFETLIDKKSPKKKKVTEKEPLFLPIKTNYLAKEQNNRQLGEKGEQLVYDYEKWRLIKAGKYKLAESIEWISKEKGDGTGFDILSKQTNGKDMFIEVKTTKLAKETPIYFSRNEWKFALLKNKDFYLYRVFNFSEQPQIFINKGRYEDFCTLRPQTFKGYF